MFINRLSVAVGSLFIALAIANPAQALTKYKIRDLGTFGGGFSDAFAISDNGYITGAFGVATPLGFPLTNNAYLFDSSNNTFENIGALTNNSSGHDVNSNGQVTGSHSVNGEERAFLYDAGILNDLGTMGGDRATGEGINSSCHIAATSATFSGPNLIRRALVYDGTSIEDIGTLDGGFAIARDINDSGHVTGGSDGQAFFYDGTGMSELPTLGGSAGTGFAINEQDHITGQSNIAGNQYAHAFFYDGTKMVDLGTLLNDTMSEGRDINDHDQVVGMSTDGTLFSAFFYDQGQMHDLCAITDCISSGWSYLAYANGINNRGEIVGHGWIGGEQHAFLASPIPVPPAFWLFGSGLIGLISVVKRKKPYRT